MDWHTCMVQDIFGRAPHVCRRTGKTYTMMGRLDSAEEKGVIPRLCEELFDRMRSLQHGDPSVSFKLETSYMEIYMEQVRCHG